MRFPLYIAQRYLFSKNKSTAVNAISSIALIGVVVGTMALFIVLSGFAGLKTFSLQFSTVFNPDLHIEPQNGKVFTFDENQKKELLALPEIASFSEVIEDRVFLNFKGKNTIAFIKGVDKNYQKTTQIDSTIIAGMWLHEDEKSVVIGFDISTKLGLGPYDYSELLEIYVPKPGTGQITDPESALNSDFAIVSGVYYVNEDLNAKYVFASFDQAKELLSFEDNQVSAIEIKLQPEADEKKTIKKLEEIMGNDLIYKNRFQQNDALYKMLNTENLAVYLIFTLVMIIALFNVISSIIMVILDKKSNIKTLLHLGADFSQMRSVFFLQGTLMTVFGGLLGILLGILLVSLQAKFGFILITPTLPYPVELQWENAVIVFLTISVLGIIASRIAAGRVNEKLIR